MLRRRPARPRPWAAAPHAARPRSGESARSRRSQERLHGSTRSDRLFGSLPRSLFLNNISLVGGLGFIIIIVIIILSVIFVVVAAAAAAPVNLSPSPRLFDLSLALCWLERCVLFCFVFF